jgi:peptidoglycan/LPS O-acetylase OafA/YrhL
MLTALAGAAVSAHPLEYGLLASIAVIALTIPVAYVSKLCCEDPFIRLGRVEIFRAASFIGSAKTKPAE